MTQATTSRQPFDRLLLAVAVLFAVLAVIVETRLRVSVHLPGHRAMPGALVLLLLADGLAPALLMAVAALLGVLTAMLSGMPILVAAWMVPAVLLILTRRAARRGRSRVAVGLLCGLLFGILRLLALPNVHHHTPPTLRIAGHLIFGVLGAAAALGLQGMRSGGRE